MSKRVLIVDDSRVQLMVMAKLLQDMFPESEVISYSSPKDALEDIKGKQLTFFFALLDYNMEGMTGIDLAEELLRLDFKPITPEATSMLSANIQEAVQNKATSLGLDFIPKPIDKEKLTAFLERKGIPYGS